MLMASPETKGLSNGGSGSDVCLAAVELLAIAAGPQAEVGDAALFIGAKGLTHGCDAAGL